MDDVKRMRLLEAALDEFAEHGIESASYNKIIERSGLSKGTVYYYFDNKDSLLDTVLDEICRSFLNAVGGLALPETKEEYWATAWEYHKRWILFFFENPRLARVLFWMSKDGLQAGERWRTEHIMRFKNALIDKGQELGAVRKDLPAETIQKLLHSLGKVLSAEVLGTSLAGCGAKARDEAAQTKVEQFMEMMHDLSRRMLSPKEDLTHAENVFE